MARLSFAVLLALAQADGLASIAPVLGWRAPPRSALILSADAENDRPVSRVATLAGPLSKASNFFKGATTTETVTCGDLDDDECLALCDEDG